MWGGVGRRELPSRKWVVWEVAGASTLQLNATFWMHPPLSYFHVLFQARLSMSAENESARNEQFSNRFCSFAGEVRVMILYAFGGSGRPLVPILCISKVFQDLYLYYIVFIFICIYIYIYMIYINICVFICVFLYLYIYTHKLSIFF